MYRLRPQLPRIQLGKQVLIQQNPLDRLPALVGIEGIHHQRIYPTRHYPRFVHLHTHLTFPCPRMTINRHSASAPSPPSPSTSTINRGYRCTHTSHLTSCLLTGAVYLPGAYGVGHPTWVPCPRHDRPRPTTTDEPPPDRPT